MAPGQHDLPNHNLKMIRESSLGVLAAAGVIYLLTDPNIPLIDAMENPLPHYSIFGCPFGTSPPDWKLSGEDLIHVLAWHHMVVNDPLWPGQEADKALAILRNYPQFDLIVSGDNHQSFAIADPKGRWLVNPGSLMRMTTAQVDHRPCIFKWDNGKLEQIFLPIEENVLDLSVADIPKDKAGRFGAFVEQLQGGKEIGISFDDNLKQYFNENPEEPLVQELVWEARGD